MRVHKSDTVIISLDNKDVRCTVVSIEDKIVYFYAEGERICGSLKDIKKVVKKYHNNIQAYHALEEGD